MKKDNNILGVMCLSNVMSIVIIDLGYGVNDVVKTGFCDGEKITGVYTSKIYYDDNGAAYFKRYKNKYYFSDFMRV